MLKIGSLTIQPGLALAPMAGITSYPFRLLAREQGCTLFYSEMISARGLHYHNRRSDLLLYRGEDEQPLGFQLFGSDPLAMARAAAGIETLGADFIDLNLGCPTRKITSNGDGGALMRSPDLCSAIFSAVVKAVSCPVTVKLRKGWDEGSVNVIDIALRAEDAGVKAVTVHGRTVEQGYSGKADWNIIRQVKERLSIPVIGNGDVDSAQAAEDLFNTTGCDGVMVGRAARGNPWIFREIRARLDDEDLPKPPSIDEIIEAVLRHFRLLAELKGERPAAREMRRHAAWYIKGLPEAAAYRQKLVYVNSYGETAAILEDLRNNASQGGGSKADGSY